jgi:hypothetical protein
MAKIFRVSSPEEWERLTGRPSSELVLTRMRGKKRGEPINGLTEPELFRRCRQALGMSQAEIAEALLVAAGRTVRRWEGGAIPIPGPAWVALRHMLAERRLPLVNDVEIMITQRRAKQSDALL